MKQSNCQKMKSTKFLINKILNEIYWVSTYVVKGIARNDIIYSEFMISNPIKNAFIKLLKQKILIDFLRN